MDPLRRIRADASPFPSEKLEGLKTGLVLFGAAFRGQNDAIHMHDAGLVCDVVDIDQGKLNEMQALYPPHWGFVCADAWQFAESATGRYDVVSVDTWTGSLAIEALASLELWCSLARKLVTVTVDRQETFVVPAGWTFSLMPRSPIASWLVLER